MKILVLTDDLIAPQMAGSALRAWEISRALGETGHIVCLAAAVGSERPAEGGPELVVRPPWCWADVIIGPAWSLQPRAFLGRHSLVVDGATPLLAELDAIPSSPEIRRRQRTAAARLPLVGARADAVLVASGAQEKWWHELLHRKRPELPIINLPFGIPAEPLPTERDEIDGIPPHWAIVLWWGGVWPWLDLDTLLEARSRLDDAPLSIVVPTAKRPGSRSQTFTKGQLRTLMKRHNLRPPQVVALDRWIPYRERHRILNRTSLICVLHRPGLEAELSFRTRALDGVWAGVPLLLSEGGEVARLTRENGWGGVVQAGDAKAVAAALEVLLSEREQLRCRHNLAEDRAQWSWSALTRPLCGILPELPCTSRSSLALATAKAALILAGGRTMGRPV